MMIFSAYEEHGFWVSWNIHPHNIPWWLGVFYRNRNTKLKERSTNEHNLMTGQGWHQYTKCWSTSLDRWQGRIHNY